MLAENALAPGVDTVQPKLIPALVIELMTTILTVTIQQLGEKLSSPDNQFQSLQISGGVEEERSVVMLHVISTQSLLLPLNILGLLLIISQMSIVVFTSHTFLVKHIHCTMSGSDVTIRSFYNLKLM